jgi:hypothetical protein
MSKLIPILTSFVFVLAGCQKEKPVKAASTAGKAAAKSGVKTVKPVFSKKIKPMAPGHGGKMPAMARPAGGAVLTGKVVETMASGGYTYALVETGGKKVWAAGKQAAIAKGDVVNFSARMPMKNFTSSTLKRTFKEIYFVQAINKGAATAAAPAAPTAARPTKAMGAQAMANHPKAGTKPGVKLDFKGLTKAAGGLTVAEVFSGKAKLGGKKVKIRGKIAKFNSGILKKNWLHLQDGTGAQGTNDLTVTTMAKAPVGSTVVIEGKLSLDKNFGFGYQYPVIVEDATVTIEKKN